MLEHHIRESPVEKEEKTYQKVPESFGEHLRTGAPLMADLSMEHGILSPDACSTWEDMV